MPDKDKDKKSFHQHIDDLTHGLIVGTLGVVVTIALVVVVSRRCKHT
tara:strand:- start:1194 stop:1334 length:141 start_codon:yes stop_codon:yes gene_type:complete